MVAFVGSVLVSLAMVALVVGVAKRRAPGTPTTWGEAMAAATFTFFALLWVYGVVPHQFLTWADNELKWRPDKILNGPFDIVAKLPFTVSYQTLRDLLVVGIYGAYLGGQIALWSVWQHRGKKPAAEVETTSYGRPLVKSG